MSENNMYILIFFVLSLLTIVFFYISSNRRIDEITEKIVKWQSLQTDFNQTQHQINVETKNIMDESIREINNRLDKIENDICFHRDRVDELNESLRKLSSETPSERCDILEKSFLSLKKTVDDYTEILLDHAMN